MPAPLTVAEGLGMRIDKSELVSIRGADGKKIKVVGTSYVYMRNKASPSWRWVKVVVTESGNNFLLSCSDLKNLNLMSKSFPEYTGKVRSCHAKADADLEDILNQPFDDELTRETGDCIAPQVLEESESHSGVEVKVKQDETSVELEYDSDLDEEQVLASEAYSLLYSLGGYTFSNLVKEGVSEAVNTVKEGEEEADDNDFDGYDTGWNQFKGRWGGTN